MAGLQVGDFDSPDETRSPDKTTVAVVRMGGAATYTEIADLRTDIARYVGQVFMGIGKGAHVIHDTGLWVFNADGVIRFAGPHTVLQNGDEVFCQALR